MSETIFDKILSKEIPAKVVFENEYVLAFEDIQPQAPIHVLVIPKKPVKSIAGMADWTPDEAGHYMRGIAEAAAAIGVKEAGYRVVFNTGKDGGQTVDYVHAHILAGRPLLWPPG